MKFEVFNKENKGMFICKDKCCIPKSDELKSLNKNYYFKLDGKRVTLKKMLEYIK